MVDIYLWQKCKINVYVLALLLCLFLPAAKGLGAVALEETVSVAVPLCDTSTCPQETLTLPEWAPQPDELILVSVAVRHPTRKVSVSGNGLTFVEIADVDNVQGNSGIHIFRSLGAAPASGAITASFFDLENNPIRTYAAVSASRFSGVDTGGTNGSGAIEATATNPGPVSDNDDMKVNITTLSDNAWTFAAGTYRTKRFLADALPSGQTLIVMDLFGGDGGDTVSLSTWYQQVAGGGTGLTMGADNDISGATDWAIATVSIKPAGGVEEAVAEAAAAQSEASSLSVTPAALDLFVGGSNSFTISGGTPEYSVAAADTAIATCHHEGTTVTVSGSGVGTTMINVTDADNNSIQVSVSVSTALTANPTALNMSTGNQSTVAVSGGVAGYSVSSTDAGVAQATLSDATTITVLAVSPGAVSINITDSVGSTIQVPVFVGTNIDPGLTDCPIPPFTTAGVGPNVMLIVDNSGSMSDGENTECTPSDGCSKWEQALTAARKIIKANPHIRFGLMRMDRSGNDNTAKSGKILVPCGYTGSFATAVDYIDWYINTHYKYKEFESQTNLAQTLASAGQYFATQLVCDENGENCVRRGMRVGDSADNTAAGDFGYYKQDYNYTYTLDGVQYDAATTDDYGHTIDTTSPTKYSCEKSFVIFLTDGMSYRDAEWDVVESVIGDYDHDGEESLSPPCSGDEKCDAEHAGTTYMDDVAQFLYESDLRSDIDGIQNVITYVVGFDLGKNDDDTLMRRAAEQGGGMYFRADSLDELNAAFTTAVADINAKISSGSAVAAISTSSSTDDYFIRAKFYPGVRSWYGYLESFALPFNESNPYWKAHELLAYRIENAGHADRKIYTYLGDQSTKKASFDGLTLPPRTRFKGSNYWNISEQATIDIINYIRGDSTLEGNPYRARDGWYLGDIIYSSPLTVGPPRLYYFGNKLPEYATYQTFKSNHAARETLVYVGANDGMLHAFKAFNDEGAQCGAGEVDYAGDKCGGFEAWAFIPEQIQPDLKTLTIEGCHQYYVDLTPVSTDVWIGTKDDTPDAGNLKWRTVLIGGNRLGGNEYFCLDVTDPSYSGFDILWDVRPFLDGDFKSSTQPAIGKIRAGDKNDAGYVETWAAIITSGYHEGTMAGKIRALNITDGSALQIWPDAALESTTQAKSAGSTYYTLTSPVAIDSDRDGYLDLIFAGDSQGTLWKFYYDYNDKVWKKFALFNTGSNRGITSEPSVIFDLDGNLRIYFGTGRYFTDGDKWDTTRNAFYCLIEKPYQDATNTDHPNNGHFTGEVVISNLKEITTIVTQADFDALLDEDKTRVYENGWFFQLDPAGAYPSERILARPLALAGVVFCTSYMPDGDVCGYGGQARLYAINYLNGLPALTSGNEVLASRVSGKRYQEIGDGIPSKPVYYFDPATKVSKLFIQKSDSSVTDPVINIGQRPLRITSWRER